MQFLMLDDDLNVVGIVSSEEIAKEWGLKEKYIETYVPNRKYKGCTIVERFFHDKPDDKPLEQLIFESNGSRWYVTSECRLFRHYKNKKVREIVIFKRRGMYMTKINGKEINMGRVIAKAFIKPDLRENEVIYVDGKLKLENIHIFKKNEFQSKIARLAKVNRKVGLFENGKLVKVYHSAYDAGRDLYYSHQAIRDMCNKTYHKQPLDVRYV